MEDHTLADCRGFKENLIEEGSTIMKENECYLLCLKRGNISRKCDSKDVCGVDNCTLRHNHLMHGASRIFVLTDDNEKLKTDIHSTFSLSSKSKMTVNTSRKDIDNVTIFWAVSNSQ